MKLVLATNNNNKVREIKQILSNKFEEFITLKELGIDVEIEETGTTFFENSFIKASTITKMTGLPALADDSGLQVDALNGAPGIFSARFAGENADDNKNIDLLLEKMTTETNRKANFVSVVTVTYPDGKTISAEGKTFGRILTKRQGSNGFGYDSVFFSDNLQKSFGEATSEEKNAISHRSVALESLCKKIK